MPDSRISQVPIHYVSAPPARHIDNAAPVHSDAVCAPPARRISDAIDVPPAERWERCRISADVASALGIPADRLTGGESTYRVRIGVTQADVNVLFNPGYVEFLGKSESFVVDGIASGSQRVEIYPNSGPGAKDGGVFKLYGGGNPFAGTRIPTNARVTLWREELVANRVEKAACGSGDGAARRVAGDPNAGARAGNRRPRKSRWLRALRAAALVGGARSATAC